MAVATGAAVAGLAIAAGGATMSFIQAGKQRQMQVQAQNDAEEAMAQAKKALDVNYYNALSVNKEPYELQRQAMLEQGAQAIDAGKEQGRGAGETAGRVQMAMNEGQSGIRTAMGNDMQTIQNKQLGEDSRLRDVGVQIDMQNAKGSQNAAATAGAAANANMQQGFQGLQNAAGQAMSMASLYPQAQGGNTQGGSTGSWGNGNAPLDWINNISANKSITPPYAAGINANTPNYAPYPPQQQNYNTNPFDLNYNNILGH